jgi:hypothetical protein
VSRAKFYADILPLLETVKLGSRNFVIVASMDRFIEASIRPAELSAMRQMRSPAPWLDGNRAGLIRANAGSNTHDTKKFQDQHARHLPSSNYGGREP